MGTRKFRARLGFQKDSAGDNDPLWSLVRRNSSNKDAAEGIPGDYTVCVAPVPLCSPQPNPRSIPIRELNAGSL
jgi:hypothetical protein